MKLEEGARILREQLKTPAQSRLWLRSIKNNNIGGDVSHMVGDVHHFAGPTTGTSRTTWAKPGNKGSARYTKNTMGYQT
ncbi:hypothetical protein R3P38DRAFT_2516762 [Favolaschia claudopus]|uniref:Uncharacterized protein n=1 Tax=Favolaschia claudopus TaxID=2862362 RepID=A0AAW0A9H8_9AGAR